MSKYRAAFGFGHEFKSEQSGFGVQDHRETRGGLTGFLQLSSPIRGKLPL